MDCTTVFSIIIGGIITWLCSWWYYFKAGKDLAKTAKELRILINALEEKGLILTNRDKYNNPNGNIYDVNNTEPAEALDFPNAEIIPFINNSDKT